MSQMLDQRYKESLGARILNLDPEECQGKSQKKMIAEIKHAQQENFDQVVREASAAMATPVVQFKPSFIGAISEKSGELSFSSQSAGSSARSLNSQKSSSLIPTNIDHVREESKKVDFNIASVSPVRKMESAPAIGKNSRSSSSFPFKQDQRANK